MVLGFWRENVVSSAGRSECGKESMQEYKVLYGVSANIASKSTSSIDNMPRSCVGRKVCGGGQIRQIIGKSARRREWRWRSAGFEVRDAPLLFLEHCTPVCDEVS